MVDFVRSGRRRLSLSKDVELTALAIELWAEHAQCDSCAGVADDR
jgi:hypothetical protein